MERASGQRRASAAGSGSASPQSNENAARTRDNLNKGPLRDLKTGTRFADAKLSGGQKPVPAARDARFVRMTDAARDARFVGMTLTRSRCSLRLR
jgi:hypothetical protein